MEPRKMPAYAVVTFSISDRGWVRDYVKVAGSIVARHGGRYLARTSEYEQTEGEHRPEHIVVIEFPSMDAAHAFYDDPDYQPHRDKRIAGTSAESAFYLVPGDDRG